MLSILFFIPALAKKTVLSVLHSLVFFYFKVLDSATPFLEAQTAASSAPVGGETPVK